MTKKFVFDESSRTLHRVVGHARTWEQISPIVRVRRRVIGSDGNEVPREPDPWYSTFGWDFEDLSLDI
ncbi:MAG: hypothetical protein H6712_22140 [Myxococcales bacterium]|nr:hypothetical protein [Myxococcales bacterium]MCB9716575.1 hypothetical protein [Myxococcales bacterium]